MKLTIRSREVLGDWYRIEQVQYDKLNPSRLRCSIRFSDADVEGTSAEMLHLAEAIERRWEYCAERCAVRLDVAGQLHFWSPRNGGTGDGVCSLEEGDELAALIRKVVVNGGEI